MNRVTRLIGMTFGWNSIGFVFSLVNGIITARLLLPTDRGVLAIALATATMLGILSSLGTNVSFRVHFPRKEVTASQYFTSTALLAPLNALLVVSFCLIYGGLFEPKLSTGAFLVLVAWLGLSSFLSLQLYDFFNASGNTAFSAFLSTFGSMFVMILLFGAFIFNPDIEGVLVAYSLGNTLRLLVGVGVIARRRMKEVSEITGNGGGRVGRSPLFTSGRRLLGLNLGQSLMYQSDRFFVGALGGSAELGQYAVAATPVGVPRVLSNSIGQVLFRRAATGDLRPREALRYTGYALLQTAVIALGVSIVAPWLIPLVFGEQYSDAVPILRVLLLAEVALSPYLVLSRIAAGLGMVNASGLSGVLGLFLMIIALISLVPLYGALGAAYACVGVFFIMSFSITLMVFHEFRSKSI